MFLLQSRPLVVGEFVAHDSSPQFGTLNHAPGDITNPLRLVGCNTNAPDFTSAFGGTADMARPVAGLVRVAHDLFQTWTFTGLYLIDGPERLASQFAAMCEPAFHGDHHTDDEHTAHQ